MNTSVQCHPSRRSERLADNLHRIEGEAPRDAIASQPSLGAVSPFRRVLVVLDGSNYAEHALPVAAEIARRAGATLQLAHENLLLGATFTERSLSFEETIGRHRQQLMRDYLEACSRRLSYDHTEVLWEALRGSRAAADLASLAGRDTLVVVATRHLGPLGWFQFGSVSERFLSLGASPILFVKGYRWPVDLSAPWRLRRVLTFLDGSPDGEEILSSAASLAKSISARHTLFRVVPTMPYAGIPWKEKVDDATAYLNCLANQLRRIDGQSEELATEIRSSDAPLAQVILTNAQQTESDVIAIAARQRSGLAKLLRSDPARYLVQHSRIPILVTRSTSS